MMVVVPPLAHGQQTQDPVVAAVVISRVRATPEEVTDRVDAERHVVDQDRAEEEPVEKKLRSGYPPAGTQPVQDTPQPQQQGRQNDDRHIGMTVQPHELGVPHKIPYRLKARLHQLPLHDPPHVGPPKPVVARRMRILLGIRGLMMHAVVTGPPQRVALSRTGPQERQRKLKCATGFERLVRKVTVVARRQGKDVQHVHGGADEQRGPAPLDEEDADAAPMHDQ